MKKGAKTGGKAGEKKRWKTERKEKMQERGEKMEDREKREDAGEKRRGAAKKNKKIYPFGCNINYFSYICTRKGIIILNVYL